MEALLRIDRILPADLANHAWIFFLFLFRAIAGATVFVLLADALLRVGGGGEEE